MSIGRIISTAVSSIDVMEYKINERNILPIFYNNIFQFIEDQFKQSENKSISSLLILNFSYILFFILI